VLGAHAGGIELVELNGGVARVRYTGMCTGCPLRPVTTASTVRPALLALDGVDELEVEGSRISAEAEARIAAAFARCSPGVSRRARGAHPRAPGSPRRRPRQR
jgi:Fe-S cluster biogenesis protein NfuA